MRAGRTGPGATPPSRCSARTRRSASGCCSSRRKRWVRRFRISRRCAACRAWRSRSGRRRERSFWTARLLGRAKTHALDGRPLAAIVPGIIPRGALLPVTPTTPIQPRQPLRGDRPRAARPHPRARDRHARHPLARARRTVRRAGGCGNRSADDPAASGRGTAPGYRRPVVTRHALRLLSVPAVAVALALTASAPAADLGVRGATWPVAEAGPAGADRGAARSRWNARASWRGWSKRLAPMREGSWKNRTRRPASRQQERNAAASGTPPSRSRGISVRPTAR